MSSEAVREALEIEAESAEKVEAALGEQQKGEVSISAGLLLESIEKERESLDLMDQAMDTLRQAWEERRRSLEQQELTLKTLINRLSMSPDTQS